MARMERVPIKNFSRASGTIFRGGAPDEQGVGFVASLGIKTIIDLRPSSSATQQECMSATRYGLNYFNIPAGFFDLPDTVISAFLAVCLHPRYQPIYVHCTDGRTRTAALVGIYRVAVEGWPFSWAYTEMSNRGFQPWQLFLKRDVSHFADRMNPLNFQQRLWALQELVESNIFSS